MTTATIFWVLTEDPEDTKAGGASVKSWKGFKDLVNQGQNITLKTFALSQFYLFYPIISVKTDEKGKR
jgi:hypothetical protein